MSSHRQHYFQANAPRDRQDDIHHYVGNVIAIAILAIVCLGAAGNYLRSTWRAAEPVVTPVPMPIITSVEEARAEGRIEGFRAGFDAARAHGCQGAELMRPVAQ